MSIFEPQIILHEYNHVNATTNDGRKSPEFNIDNLDLIFRPTSPTLPPWHNKNIVPLEFSDKIPENATFTRPSLKRKCIYGDEYMEPTLLTAEPQAKLIKLEQPEYQNLSTPSATNTTIIQPTIIAGGLLNDDIPSCSKYCKSTVKQQESIDNEQQPQEHSSITLANEAIIAAQIASILTPQQQLYQIQQQQLKNRMNQPRPTPTRRNYIKKNIDYHNLPILCTRCYSCKCICYLFYNPNH